MTSHIPPHQKTNILGVQYASFSQDQHSVYAFCRTALHFFTLLSPCPLRFSSAVETGTAESARRWNSHCFHTSLGRWLQRGGWQQLISWRKATHLNCLRVAWKIKSFFLEELKLKRGFRTQTLSFSRMFKAGIGTLMIKRLEFTECHFSTRSVDQFNYVLKS